MGWDPVSVSAEGARRGQHTKPLHSLSLADHRRQRGTCGEMPQSMTFLGINIHMTVFTDEVILTLY